MLLDKNNNNNILNEILLFCFEGFILPYFEEEKRNKSKQYLQGISLKYFKLSCDLLKNSYNTDINSKYIYQHLSFLYSIAYIKIYLSYYIEFNRENNNLQNFKDINDVIVENMNQLVKQFKYIR